MAIDDAFVGLDLDERTVERDVFFVEELAFLPEFGPASAEVVLLDVDRDVIESCASPLGLL